MRHAFAYAMAVGLALFSPITLSGESITPHSAFKDCDACPEMIAIPAGSFMMGSPTDEPQRGDNEGPQHQVHIQKPFAIGKFEVTFDEWDACVSGDGCDEYLPVDRGWGRGRRPVILVSWEHAHSYVAWLNETTGKRYRLPSEAEWEYAARAGTTTPFSSGETITTEQANFNGEHTYNGSAKGVYRERTTDLGSFEPNGFGLHDMHGNIYEYVEDCWHDDYTGAPSDGSAWMNAECKYIVKRGGSWKGRPAFIRSAARSRALNNYVKDTFGFRVARDIDE